MINILMPIGGRGQRFVDAGFKNPKPLIELNGKPIVEWSAQSLKSSKLDCRFIFIYNRKYTDSFKIVLNRIDPEHICVDDEIEKGMATACIQARKYIEDENPVVVAACDQFVKWNFDEFVDFALKYDGACPVFRSKKDAYSYAKIDDDFNVLQSAEKNVISDWANLGIYFFRRGSDFVEATENMINKKVVTNGEFYIAPIYNQYAINKKIKAYPLKQEDVFILGTPEELSEAEERMKNG